MSIFDFEVDPIHGVAIVATRDRLTTSCLNDGELDAQIEELKRVLEAVAHRAKRKMKTVREAALDL